MAIPTSTRKQVNRTFKQRPDETRPELHVRIRDAYHRAFPNKSYTDNEPHVGYCLRKLA